LCASTLAWFDAAGLADNLMLLIPWSYVYVDIVQKCSQFFFFSKGKNENEI